MDTKQLAEFVAGLQYADLTENAILQAKMCVEDIIGVAIAGESNQTHRLFSQALSGVLNHTGVSTIWGKGFPKTSALEAATLNGSAGHVLDMDDLHNASIVHIGIVTIPTALAVAEELAADGRDLLLSIVAGYDVAARIGAAINPESYKYWHTTGVAGTFSAAAAAAKLKGFNADQLCSCFGTAGSQAAGLLEFLSDGAMSKSLHTAKANFNGILSAQLTSVGYTGATEILTGEKGMLGAMAGGGHPDRLTTNFAQPLQIEMNSFKPYACCRHIHAGIYAVQKLMRSHSLDYRDVNRIEDRTYSVAVETASNKNPKTVYGRKFSIEYCLAAAVVLGDVLPEAFTESTADDPRIAALMSRVGVQADPELDKVFAENPDKWLHTVTIVLNSGETFTEHVDYPIGDYKNPYHWEDIDGKFRRLTACSMTEAMQDVLLERIHNLENVQNVRELFYFEGCD